MQDNSRETELIGGLERRAIEIVDYDPQWPQKYREHADRIHRALGDRLLLVEHVGSTSVPGLGAKAIIDIDVVVADSSDESAYLPALEDAGYLLRVREPDWHEHRMMRTPALDVHIHIFSPNTPEVERHLTLRDRLRSHASDRERYEAIKRKLSKQSWDDMNAYANAKTEVIESILASAHRGPTQPTMNAYLQSSNYIDWHTPSIGTLADTLSRGKNSDEEITKACFEFVRDEIKHSWDHRLNPVTLKASEVLQHGTGYCYAKSHLLAALLRANRIPAALCYQRLTIENERPPFCLHGLNAVHLEGFGWIRIDARGNKTGVNAEFCPPQEGLAFKIKSEGEQDIEGYFSEPLKEVIEVLSCYTDVASVARNLPDMKR